MSVRAWLQLGRVSNLPTCVSNVLVGCALGAGGGAIPWLDAAVVSGAIAAMYLGGMALNDWADRRVDAGERPDRPIPSGRVGAAAVLVAAVVALVAGLGALAVVSVPAFAAGAILVATIVAYDLLNKKTAWAVLLMGACRGLVYIVAAAAVAWPPAVGWTVAGTMAGAITFYTILITLVARAEAKEKIGARRWLAVLMLLVAVAPAALGTTGLTPIGIAVVGAWLAISARHAFVVPPRTKLAVMGWLAGMCLVDGLYLLVLGRPGLAAIAAGCFVLTALGHRRILGS